MPFIEYFPYRGPSRHMDMQVVGHLPKLGPSDDAGFPRRAADIRDLLTMLMGHVEKHQIPGYIEESAELLRKKEHH